MILYPRNSRAPGIYKEPLIEYPDLGGMGKIWESVPAEEEWRQLMEYFAHDDCGRLVVLTTTGSYK